METSIYEVDSGEYKGFIAQINPDTIVNKTESNEGVRWLKTYSKTSGKLLATIETYIEREPVGMTNYYVFEFPPAEDRIAAKPVRTITITDDDVAKEFYKELVQHIKVEKKNG
jgi:hypothetical protein